MKRIFILVVVTLLVVGSSFANEKTLIDFSLLTADTTVTDEQGNEWPQNEATLVDFTNEATSNFTARQRAEMQSSLAIENWNVVLAPSARNVTSNRLSFTREAPSQEFGTVMGVRVHFPTGPFNSWARVEPPFPIPANQPPKEEGGPNPFEGFGIIENVGTIRSLAVNVYGLNFPHSLSVILIDRNGRETIHHMGSLNFEGWGHLRWDNPAYIDQVRNREIRVEPIYPDSMPYLRFGGFLINRSASHKGGDFIAYFQDIKVIYDQAVLEDVERDIDHEGIWQIIQEGDTRRNTSDMQTLGQLEAQRRLELGRQAQSSTFSWQEESSEEQQ